MFIGFIVQILWNQMLDISFLPMNSFITIEIPGIPQTIQAVMIKYIYFDIFYTEFWIDIFMESIGIPFDTLDNDYALNWQFSDNGYESKLFLKNAGSSIFILIIYLSSLGILIIFGFLSLISNKIRTIK
jgi:hypothetical protein